MSNLALFDYSGQGIRFEQCGDRIWVCLTDMAKATDKRVNDWLRLKSTTEFLTCAESFTGIPVLSESTGGGIKATGTWAVEEVAIDFASWCSVEFRFWVSQQIRILMITGKVELKPTNQTVQTISEFLQAQMPEDPTKWKRRFTKKYYEHVERLYGRKQNDPGMAAITYSYIYRFFPKEVRNRLDEINPIGKNYKRKNRLHQHFDNELLALLEEHILKVTHILEGSKTKEDFIKSMKQVKLIRLVAPAHKVQIIQETRK